MKVDGETECSCESEGSVWLKTQFSTNWSSDLMQSHANTQQDFSRNWWANSKIYMDIQKISRDKNFSKK